MCSKEAMSLRLMHTDTKSETEEEMTPICQPAHEGNTKTADTLTSIKIFYYTSNCIFVLTKWLGR